MIAVTAGGVLVGLAFLAAFLVKKWPGKKVLKSPVDVAVDFLPFLFGYAYGTLGTLALGGLIGWAFDTATWILNWLGDVALWVGVGAEVGTSAQGTYLPLTLPGTYVVVLLTVIVVCVIRFRACGPEVGHGTLTGALLSTSTSVAGALATPLAQAANWTGSWLFGPG